MSNTITVQCPHGHTITDAKLIDNTETTAVEAIFMDCHICNREYIVTWSELEPVCKACVIG